MSGVDSPTESDDENNSLNNGRNFFAKKLNDELMAKSTKFLDFFSSVLRDSDRHFYRPNARALLRVMESY